MRTGRSTDGRDRFEGAIAGIGTASGTRIVLGMWERSRFGAFADAMIERPDGHRILLAPSEQVADYVAATYSFDEVVVTPTTVDRVDGRVSFTAESLTVGLEVGPRTGVGLVLRAVPAPVARARWWCALIGPFARLLRQGVRTTGTAGGGRREWYGAHDEHALRSASARLDGDDLGALSAVRPPVRFGFGSTPSRPTLVRLTSTVERD